MGRVVTLCTLVRVFELFRKAAVRSACGLSGWSDLGVSSVAELRLAFSKPHTSRIFNFRLVSIDCACALGARLPSIVG